MRHTFAVILLLCLSCCVFAWKPWPLPMDSADTHRDTLFYGASLTGVFGNSFWISANTNGDIVPTSYNGILSLYTEKPASRPNRWWDYSFGVQFNGRCNGEWASGRAGERASGRVAAMAYFQKLYAHCRLYIFDITAGIKPFSTTFGDEDLSIGSLLISKNAHSMPRVSIGIDRWTTFPFSYGYMEIRGGISHLWAFNSQLSTLNSQQPSTFTFQLSPFNLHYKYAGVRIGGKLPVNISYEFHHAAQWGGISPVYGDLGNNFEAFKNVFLGRSGGNTAIESNNVQGNHLCMQQLALELKFSALHISAYWQALQEDGPIKFIGTTMNNADGLWGLNISQYYFPYIQTLTYEFLNTTEQSGPVHDIDGFIFGGRDTYYFHSIYTQGWTFLGRTIGNPLLSPDNNRVRAHHIGIKGDIFTYQYRLLCTHAACYPKYAEDLSYNQSREIKYRQTSLFLEVNKTVHQAWGLNFSAALGIDFYSQIRQQTDAASADGIHPNIGGKITVSKVFRY